MPKSTEKNSNFNHIKFLLITTLFLSWAPSSLVAEAVICKAPVTKILDRAQAKNGYRRVGTEIKSLGIKLAVKQLALIEPKTPKICSKNTSPAVTSKLKKIERQTKAKGIATLRKLLNTVQSAENPLAMHNLLTSSTLPLGNCIASRELTIENEIPQKIVDLLNIAKIGQTLGDDVTASSAISQAITLLNAFIISSVSIVDDIVEPLSNLTVTDYIYLAQVAQLLGDFEGETIATTAAKSAATRDFNLEKNNFNECTSSLQNLSCLLQADQINLAASGSGTLTQNTINKISSVLENRTENSLSEHCEVWSIQGSETYYENAPDLGQIDITYQEANFTVDRDLEQLIGIGSSTVTMANSYWGCPLIDGGSVSYEYTGGVFSYQPSGTFSNQPGLSRACFILVIDPLPRYTYTNWNSCEANDGIPILNGLPAQSSINLCVPYGDSHAEENVNTEFGQSTFSIDQIATPEPLL